MGSRTSHATAASTASSTVTSEHHGSSHHAGAPKAKQSLAQANLAFQKAFNVWKERKSAKSMTTSRTSTGPSTSANNHAENPVIREQKLLAHRTVKPITVPGHSVCISSYWFEKLKLTSRSRLETHCPLCVPISLVLLFAQPLSTPTHSGALTTVQLKRRSYPSRSLMSRSSLKCCSISSPCEMCVLLCIYVPFAMSLTISRLPTVSHTTATPRSRRRRSSKRVCNTKQHELLTRLTPQ